jgi:hypothetical protein
MKAIVRRLCRLELNLGVRESNEPSAAEIIYERRRQRLLASGLPCEEHPPGYFRGLGSEVIDAEVLRNATAEAGGESDISVAAVDRSTPPRAFLLRIPESATPRRISN